MTGNAGSPLDTFPKLVRDNAERLPRHVAIREKDLGIWQSYTWRDYLDAAAASRSGWPPWGSRGATRPRSSGTTARGSTGRWSRQALGGVPVPLYQDSIEKEMNYIVEHAEARFAVVEDQEQVDKLLALRAVPPPGAHRLRRSAGAAPLRAGGS